MIVTIKGKRWSLVFVPKVDEADSRGECNNGRYMRRILVRKRMSSEETMEVVIHEMLHALRWTKSERDVTMAALEIARVLARLGYRRKR